jgi:hypothetical protein
MVKPIHEEARRLKAIRVVEGWFQELDRLVPPAR